MPIAFTWRRLCAAAVVGLAVALGSLVAPPTLGGPTAAAAQVSEDFIYALEPYGRWIHHRRFGEVWIPFDLPRGWRPYEYGHWVYTDEWGWFWVSDPEEEDWGWITFHYGRWAYERRIGWFWVPGDEWAPAWVDWRYGDGYVGWAPLPPDPYIEVYEADPLFWAFVAVRYLTQPRWRHYAVSSRHRAAWLRRSHVVNRTFGVRGARLAVNPGLSPAFVAAQTHSALPAYRVRPRVFAHTRGVEGALHVQRDQLRAARSAKPRRRGKSSGRHAVAVQRTTTVIRPSTSAAPQRLRKGQRGHLGSHPPRAAQGGAAPKQQQVQPPPPTQLQPLQQQKARQPAQQQQQRQQRHKERRDQQRDHQPPQAKPTRPLVPQTPPPAVKKLTPPPAVKKQTPPPTVKKRAPPPAPTVKQAPPPKMKKQTPAPRVKQAPPPTVRRVAPPPTMRRVAPPAQPKHPVVKHAPPPKPARVHRPRPPAKKQAAPAERAAKPAAKKKSDDKQKPEKTPR